MLNIYIYIYIYNSFYCIVDLRSCGALLCSSLSVGHLFPGFVLIPSAGHICDSTDIMLFNRPWWCKRH